MASASGTNATSYGGNNGTATVVASGGTPGYSYHWITGSTGVTISGLTAGTYTVTVTDIYSNTATASYTVTQPLLFSVSVTGINVSCFGGNGGTVTALISGGTSPFIYVWSNGGSGVSIDNLIAGVYFVTVTDFYSNTTSASYFIIEPSVLNDVSTATNVSCNSGNNGVILNSVSGGVSPYIYLWNNSTTTSGRTGLVAGAYSVTITDANGCSMTRVFNIFQPSTGLSVSSSVTNVGCFGANTGTAGGTATGGTSPYTYLWNNGSSNSGLSNLSSGTYSVTVTDGNNCRATRNYFVIQPSSSLTTSTTRSNVSCFGGSTGAAGGSASGGTSPYSYLWNNGSTNSSISNLSASTFTVTVTDGHSCSATRSYIITQPASLTANMSGSTQICPGNTATLPITFVGGTAPRTLVYNDGTNHTIITNSNPYNLIVSPILTTTYTLVSVTDVNSCSGVVSGGAIVTMNTIGLWIGVTSTDWNTSSNWCGGIPTLVTNVEIPVGVPNMPNIGSAGGLSNNIVIDNGASLTISGSNNLTINGNWVNNGSFMVNSNMVTMIGTGVTISGNVQTIFNSLDVTGIASTAQDVTFTGNITVSPTGSLTQTMGTSTFNGSTTLTGEADLNNVIVNTGSSLILSSGSTLGIAGSFVSNIGDVLTFDCNSTVNYNGGNQTVIPISYGNLTVSSNSGAAIKTIPLGNLVICHNLTSTDGAGGSVTTNSAANTTVGNNVFIDNNNAYYALNDITIGGNLTSSGTFSASAGATTMSGSSNSISGNGISLNNYIVAGNITANNSFVILGNFTINNGSTFDATATTESLYGNMNNLGVFTDGTGTLDFLGTANSTINGLTTFNNVTIDKSAMSSATVILNNNITINNTLDFIGGNLVTGNSKVILGLTASETGAGQNTGWVNGNEENLLSSGNSSGFYAVGDVSFYAPVNISFNGVLVSGTGVVVNTVDGNHPQINSSLIVPGTSVTRYWNVTNDGVSLTNYDATFNFPTSDLNTGSHPNSFQIGQYNGSNWSMETIGTRMSNSTQATGITTFGAYQIGNTPPVILINPSSSITCDNSTVTFISSAQGYPTPSVQWMVSTNNGITWSPVNGAVLPTLTFVASPSENGNLYHAVYSNNQGSDSTTYATLFVLHIIVSATSTNVTCNGSNNGTITITASGTLPPYQYSINNGVTHQVANAFNGLSVGIYQVVVKDSNSCVSTAINVSITQPNSLLAASVQGPDITCNGGTTIITVSATGGTSPYTGIGIYSVSAGYNEFTVTDGNGCTSTTSITISEPSPLIATSTQGASVLCFGNPTTVEVDATGGTPPYSGIGTFNVTAGAYTYFIEDFNGCATITSISINEPSSPVTTISTQGAPILCFGDLTTVTVYASGGTPNYVGTGVFTIGAGVYTYTVTDANGCEASSIVNIDQPSELIASSTQGTNIQCHGGTTTVSVDATGGTPNYAGTITYAVSAGSNTYTVIDLNGCFATTTISITEPPALVASSIQSSAILCNGGTTSVTVSAIGGISPYIGTGTVNSVSTGSHTYTVTDANSCTTSTSLTILQPSVLVASSIQGSAILCHGGTTSVTLDATGGTSPYVGTGTIASVTAGSHTYTITDTNGCTSTTIINISEPVAALSATSIQNSVILCHGGTTSITINATGGTSPYTGSGILTSVAASSYTYTVTDANGCSTTTSLSISEPAISLSAASLQGVDILCYGNSTSVTVSANGGTSPYSGTGTFTSVTAGVYTYTVADANGCSAITSLAVAQPTSAVIASSSQGAAILCNGGTTTVNVSATGGIFPYTGTGTFSSVTAGSHTYTVTDANGCTSATIINISQPSTALSASSTQAAAILCNGGNTSITIAATGGTSPYIGTGILTSVVAGSNTYTVSDVNGCTISTSINITQPATALSATTQQGIMILCHGGTTTVTVYANGGTAPYNGTGTFTSVSAGNYTYTVTDANGCMTTTSIDITEPATALSAASSQGAAILCNGGSTTITVSATGGTSPYNGIGTFSNVSAGVHVYNVVDTNGCATSTTITVFEPIMALSATVMQGTVILCHGGSTSVTVVAMGGTSPYTGTGTFVSISAGVYTYTVTDANGCMTSATIFINEPSNALAVSSSQNVPILCHAGLTSVTIAATGGTSPYTGTGIFTSVSAGAYIYTVTDANGCSASSSLNISEPAVALSAASVQVNPIQCNGGSTSVVVSATGGTGNYIGTGAFSVVAGSYTYTVTDANNCISITSIIISQPVTPLSTTATQGAMINCYLGTTSVTINATGGTSPYLGTGTFTAVGAGTYTYTVTDANGCTATTSLTITQPTSWTTSATTGTILCNGNSTSVVITASGGTTPYTGTGTFYSLAGTYTYTVTDGGGCTLPTVVTITQPTAITYTINHIDIPCNGGTYDGSITISASGGSGTLAYSIDNGVHYQSTGNFVGLQAATYSVRINDANNCLTAASVINVYRPDPFHLPYNTPFANQDCWTIQHVSGTGDWALGDTVNTGVSPLTGHAMIFKSSTYPAGTVSRLISPLLTFAGVPDPDLNYSVLTDNLLNNVLDSIAVYISTDGGATYTYMRSALRKRATAPAWLMFGIDLHPYAGDTNIRVMFEAHSAGGGNDMALDSISFFQAVCPVAVNLFATATSNTITFHWSDQQNAAPTDYIVRYAKNVTDSTFWTTATVLYPNHQYTTPPILFQNTQYFYQVRSECGVDAYGQPISAGYPIAYDSIATCIPLNFTGVPTSLNICSGSSVVVTAPNGFPNYTWSNGATTQSISTLTPGTFTLTVPAVPGCPNQASVTVTQTCGTPTGMSTSLINSTSGFAQWVNVTCADSFNIQWRVHGNPTWTNTITKKNNSYQIIGLSGNTTYDWQVRTVCLGHIFGPFAAMQTFTTCPVMAINGNPTDKNLCVGGTVILTVASGYNTYAWTTGATTPAITVSATGSYGVTATGTGGCTGALTQAINHSCPVVSGMSATPVSHGANVSWNSAAECGTSYNLQYRRQGTTPWTFGGTYTGNSASITGLLASTLYNWAIRTNCSSSSDTSSYLAGPNFTSGARLDGTNDDGLLSFKVYPNPANDHITVVFPAAEEGNYLITIYDVMGREIYSQHDQAIIGDNLKQISLNQIAKGVYSLELRMGDATNKVKLVIQ